jgi:hypothetical protein
LNPPQSVSACEQSTTRLVLETDFIKILAANEFSFSHEFEMHGPKSNRNHTDDDSLSH